MSFKVIQDPHFAFGRKL